jgi:hypothetical protein
MSDVNVLLVRAMAWFIALTFERGERTKELRRRVSTSPSDLEDVTRKLLLKFAAWLLLGVLVFFGTTVFSFVDDWLNPSVVGVVDLIAGCFLVFCFVVATFMAIRLAISWYVTEEKWEDSGRLLRFLVLPSNLDVLLGAILVVGGNLLSRVD